MGNRLRAGVAEIDISPGQGVQLAGYPTDIRPNTGVHDPLYADCLVLDRDGARIALVTSDTRMEWSDELPHFQPWFGTGVYANAFEAKDPHVRCTRIEEVRGVVIPDWRGSPVMAMVLEEIDVLEGTDSRPLSHRTDRHSVTVRHGNPRAGYFGVFHCLLYRGGDRCRRLLRAPEVMGVDCTVARAWDPTPMTPKKVGDTLAGSGVMAKARCGGTPEEIADAIEGLARPGMRLILDIARIEADDELYRETAKSNYAFAREKLSEAFEE